MCLAAVGCRKPISDKPVGAAYKIAVPLGLPPVPFPPGNPPTSDSIALGRLLFYDKHLSKDNTLSCATCHNPTLGFTDGLRLSRGVGGTAGVRNAPTIINVAYLPFQFWDGRAASLETQAIGPLADPTEMNQAHDVSVSKLGGDAVYVRLFNKTFGDGGVTIGRVQNALASFERTILVGDSAFDRYQFAGDRSALTPAQIRGLAIFQDSERGNCASCHTIRAYDALFTDGQFHNTGEGVNGDGVLIDTGRFHETRVSIDQGAFKTPTLRNVATTAPYMHDGSLKTLKEVVDFYAGGGNSNPNLDAEMSHIHLSARDRSDLVEFLQALTGNLPENVSPPILVK